MFFIGTIYLSHKYNADELPRISTTSGL